MSGTSLDGIDAALIEVVPSGAGYAIELERFVTVPFAEDLYAQLVDALPPNVANVATAASLHRRLGAALADAAAAVAEGRIDFVASHGQTIWHDGANALTVQIGDPYVVRDRIGATVCFDFRAADCAAGGHGAPLVPYVNALLFSHPVEDRIAHQYRRDCKRDGAATRHRFGVLRVRQRPRKHAAGCLRAFSLEWPPDDGS